MNKRIRRKRWKEYCAIRASILARYTDALRRYIGKMPKLIEYVPQNPGEDHPPL